MVHPRKLFLLIVALLLLVPHPARARGWELVTGRIQSLVREGNQLTLTLEPDKASGLKSSPITLEVPAEACSGELKKGTQVRIWSKTKGSGATVYKISASRGCDPTGVRLRLRKHGHRFGGRRGGRGGHGGH